ncbi:MAGE-like protein 2 [Dermacentor silvarum]|uniref:MAGE-like protein 2 n=1 Tax=Dermacentor silvarum TaxID=543639 RepID=UPI002100A706|nr:MAGE-like protein 2 [Dermacentor silvarum]
MTQHSVFYDESCGGGGTLQRQRQDAYFDYSEPVGPAGPVPRQEPPQPPRRPIMLPPTTVVVNLSESGVPPPPSGPPARPGSYDTRQVATRASMRSHEEFRTPQRHQQSDMQVRNAPMTTQLTQQLRDIALQHQRPLDDNVISSTERVIYEVIRKMESTSSETSEDRPQTTIVRAQNQGMGAMSPMMSPQRQAMSPQRPAMSPPGVMSPGMMRGPSPGMIRSPISAGSRGYLVRAPSGLMRAVTPRMPVQYPQRWPPSARATPLTPAGRPRRDDDGMTLFPERSLIMLLVFLFLFVLVVVILAISGMNFPAFSKSKNSSS